jgi:hypothetical protein
LRDVDKVVLCIQLAKLNLQGILWIVPGHEVEQSVSALQRED